jgi:hypothetical protein
VNIFLDSRVLLAACGSYKGYLASQTPALAAA